MTDHIATARAMLKELNKMEDAAIATLNSADIAALSLGVHLAVAHALIAIAERLSED